MASDYIPELDSFELYHKEQETTNVIGPALPALGHAISGAVGAAISNAVTYPLQLVITRLQVQHQLRASSADSDEQDAEYKDISDAVERIYRDEGGIQAFYAGVGQEVAKSVADSFIFFLAYTLIRTLRKQSRGTNKLPAAEELGMGMAAGAISKLFTTPVQNIVTRKQTAAMTRRKGGARSNLSARDIALQIRKEKGVLGFWTGYSATLFLTLNPGLTFLLHGFFEKVLRKTTGREGKTATFILAATAKAIASFITYPFSLAKSRSQVSKRKITDRHAGGDLSKGDSLSTAEHKVEAKFERNTIVGEVVKIAREEGPTGLYQGLSGEVFKGFFQHGLTMLMKDSVFAIVVQLYYVMLKVLRRYPSPEELAAIARERAERAAADAQQQAAELVKKGKNMVSEAQKAVLGPFNKDAVPVGDVYGKGFGKN